MKRSSILLIILFIVAPSTTNGGIQTKSFITKEGSEFDLSVGVNNNINFDEKVLFNVSLRIIKLTNQDFHDVILDIKIGPDTDSKSFFASYVVGDIIYSEFEFNNVDESDEVSVRASFREDKSASIDPTVDTGFIFMFSLNGTINPADNLETINLNETQSVKSEDGGGLSGIIFLIIVVLIIIGYLFSKKKKEEKLKKKEIKKDKMLKSYPSLVQRVKETEAKLERIQKEKSQLEKPEKDISTKKIISIACNACGDLNQEGSIFCLNCGTKL